MQACHLEGVANQENVLARIFRIQVPLPDGIQPFKIFYIPDAVAVRWITRAACGYVNVEAQIGYFRQASYVKYFPFYYVAKLAEDLFDTSHSLIGKTFVHVENG